MTSVSHLSYAPSAAFLEFNAMAAEPVDKPARIGFVATRISGTDGVSLEIGKWAEILERMGHTCFYITGESDRPAERSHLVPEAHFKHTLIQQINRQSFGRQVRTPEVSGLIHEMTWVIKEKLRSTIERFGIDVLIAENCVSIPLNIPLGLALVETVMETGIGCIAHHHDFAWERERFLVNAVDDYLRAAFPPALPQMQHVVLSAAAAREFSRRTGLSCRVIPNVMDFDNPPPPPDDYGRQFPKAVGLGADDRLILQPTRIVQRKGIEQSVELVRQLGDARCKLVITHASGDEGHTYRTRVRKYASLMGVHVIFAETRVGHARTALDNGDRIFTIWDAYQAADLVTYPSTYEGFGNAFLEAVFYKKPILCNRYAIYRSEIEPCGFQAILMDGFLTDDVVERARSLLADGRLRREMVEHNYEIARRYFSYGRVKAELRALLAKPRLTTAGVS
jgi:glycosyltransferase involved in cell wall biosynthesis